MSIQTASLLAAAALLSAVALGQEKLEERTYKLSGGILETLKNVEEAPVDPFADLADNVPAEVATTIKLLERGGITFGPKTSAIYDKKKGHLTVVNSVLEHARIESLLDDLVTEAGSKLIHTVVEYVEVEHENFSDWVYENQLTSDSTPLRKEVQKWVKAKRAAVLDTSIITARSGQRSKTEGVKEFIYPTSADPAEIPNTVTLSGGSEAPATASSPTAFDVRNLGITTEVDPVLGADNVTVDLNLSPESVKLAGFKHWPTEKSPSVSTPKFHSMKISTAIKLRKGAYALLGTTRPLEGSDPARKDPLVLVFARADISNSMKWERLK